MTDRPLTPREEELLQLIVAFVSERGYAPSREEMVRMHNRARSSVERNLAALRAKGRVFLDGHRAIRVAGMRWKPEPSGGTESTS